MPVTTAPTQSELEFKGLQPTDPLYLIKLLISEVQTDLTAHRRHLLMVTSKWVMAYRFIRVFEDDVMLGEPSETERQFFRGAVGILKGLGILLSDYLRRNEQLEVDPLGFTFQDLTAMVQELVDTDHALHSDMTPEMAKQIDAVLFGHAPVAPDRSHP